MRNLGRPVVGERSPLLDETVRLAVPVVVVTSVYLLFAGHNAPGGGFIGGLVGGSAVFLRFVTGSDELRPNVLRLPFEAVLGTGILLSFLTGVTSLLDGGPFMEAWTFSEDVPVLGTVKFTASLPFDIGVYLVVVGLALAIVESLGREPEDVELHAPTRHDGASST